MSLGSPNRSLVAVEEVGYDGPITFESICEGDLLAPMAQARECVEEAIKRVMSPA